MSSALPPVPFSAWLRSMQAALAEEAPADVACGDCCACCSTSHFIHVRPEERGARARLPRTLLFPAPGLPPGNLVLGYDEAGRCPMLADGLCSIYHHRPIVCRTFDCRIYAATGVAPDREAIAAQVRRWRFSYPSQVDGGLRDAVLAAVRFMREHPECIPGDAARHQPVRVAVLAIAVHESFLEDGAAGAAGRESSHQDKARAVTAANERLFGDG